MRYSPRSLMLAITATVTLVVIAVAWPTGSTITVATVEATSTKPTGLTTTAGNAEATLGRVSLQDRTTLWYEL